jgi:hypothetical protein
MDKIVHQNSPVLGGIRIVIYILGNEFTQSSLFGEPFTAQACDGMPANLNGPQLTADGRFSWWDNIGLLSQANGVLEHELTLQGLLFAGGMSNSGEPVHSNGLTRTNQLLNLFSLFSTAYPSLLLWRFLALSS